MKGIKHKTLVELAELNPETTEESLIKAMNKEGLVQKEVTVHRKNGTTFTRKQWVRASEVKESKSPKGKKGGGDDKGNKKKPPFKFDLNKFNSIKSDRTAALDYLKESGITWKEHEHKGVNWMRAMVAAKEQTGISDITAKENKFPKNNKNAPFKNKVSKQDANKQIDDLVKEHGRDGLLKLAKEQGITWSEVEHKGVNWMHARMAIRSHIEQGNSFVNDKSEISQDKQQNKQSKSKKDKQSKSKKDKESKFQSIHWGKQLEHLNTRDFQGRGYSFPKPNIPDSIQVVSNDGSSATVYGSFKNTDEQTAKKYMENYIKNELRDYLNKLEIVVDSQQSGDYHNDWVSAFVSIKPKNTK